MAYVKRHAADDPGRTQAGRNLMKLGRFAAVMVGLSVLIASAGPVAAHVAEPGQLHAASSATTDRARTGCGHFQRVWSLALEQQRVLKFLKDFLVIRNDADLARLGEPREGALYAIHSHEFANIRGMGFSIVNGAGGGPGMPTLLMYRPSPKAKDVVDPHGPDYPYELAGWGYAGPYTPGVAPPWITSDPLLKCVYYGEWFVHERSVHPFDTWQNIPVPPVEDFPGQVPAGTAPTPDECTPACIGASHPRLWDLHLWTGKLGVPTVSMLNPGPLLRGFDPVVGVGFFYSQAPQVVQPPSGAPAAAVAPNTHIHQH